jgi:hypothetical protein
MFDVHTVCSVCFWLSAAAIAKAVRVAAMRTSFMSGVLDEGGDDPRESRNSGDLDDGVGDGVEF